MEHLIWRLKGAACRWLTKGSFNLSRSASTLLAPRHANRRGQLPSWWPGNEDALL